ncbi:hypothetical protein HK104_001010 [Borealophlyctis nickersoniae]|nr:hypothetical protein HK104_001010 [Borealophlyctis nickersoniae]
MHLSSVLLTALLAHIATSAPTPQLEAGDNACSPVEILSARGTTEPQSGSLVMASVINNIQDKVPGTTLYNVVYPANTDFVGGPIIGSKDLLDHLTERAKTCANQTYVLMGYSQGALVLGRSFGPIAAGKAGADTFDRIKAVIMFGNPNFNPTSPAADGSAAGVGLKKLVASSVPDAFLEKTKDFCNQGDPICTATGANILVHALYGISPQSRDAAAFAVEKLDA